MIVDFPKLPMEYRTVDLDKAEQAVTTVYGHAQTGYQPQTLRLKNGGRSVYLPSFPSKSKMPSECLLLSNVPGKRFQAAQHSLFSVHSFLAARLGTHEILRCQHGANTEEALMCVRSYDYHGEFSLSEEDAEELSRRLQVGMSIILFNAVKLRGNCYGLMAYYQAFRRNILQKKDVASRESPLNSKTMAIALEFYLQMDGESSHVWIFM